jgi:predicted translin family RNA/ssDNA-binding protein
MNKTKKENKNEKNIFGQMKKEFSLLKKEFDIKEKVKLEISSTSKTILKESKKAIFMIHRNDLIKAKSQVDQIEKEILNLMKKFNIVDIENSNIFHSAIQEFVEARTFLDFIMLDKIEFPSKLKISVHDYLCGLADLTGEVGRRAVICATQKDISKVKKIKDFVDFIHQEFIEFDFSNGELRKKFDAIKWNLNKIENIIYDLSIRDNLNK